jgi:hypothetical protein
VSFGRVACQDVLMGGEADLAGRMGPELEVLLPLLDERSRRLVLGAVARAAGAGGVTAVARVAGASWQTVSDGAAELGSGQVAGPGRVRRPGGGRRKLAESDPGLVPALLELVEDSTRGDPGSPLTWTTKSLASLAGELAGRGHRCSVQTVWRLLREQGFSLQANAKTIEGSRHPDRDAQFGYIAAQAKEHMAAGQPVISVDAKKKEQVGEYASAGREWRPARDPVQVRDHSFPDEELGKVTPYGIYDVAANTGFVNVGTDHDTAAFAVESIRCWWDTLGRDAYPGARRLLVTADAGGSNGYRTRAWKTGLARLAAETGLEITVCHFPPGTSKWNKIEHRLFAQISRNWRARPLTSHEVIIKTIAATTTRTGLAVTAQLDTRDYPAGARSTGAQVRELEDTGALTRHEFHGDWNYTIGPAARAPAPRPAPAAPAPAGPALGQILDALASPALTGMSRQDLDALVTALSIPFAAAREQRLHLARGRPRRKNSGRATPVTLTLPACLLAALCRYRLGMTCQHIADLLDVDQSAISMATRNIAGLLSRHATPITPGPDKLRTTSDLRRHAAAAGITIPSPRPANST